ncbi:MAG: hypothetical protein KIT72_07565 [Polyangiaceae bacterium]|nr:hypothetical protein [Polyangiaceae bacterium]
MVRWPGWCPLSKRLEQGSFQLLLSGDEKTVAINGAAFASLLAGIDFATVARRGWFRAESTASIGDRHPRSGV